MLAVIRTGGKQYLVTPGQKINIEKLEGDNLKEGAEVSFKEVLLVEKGNKLEIGSPLVKGATVKGKITGQGKGEKVIVFKFRPKKRSKTKKGHRQPFTEVEITKIELPSVAKSGS